MIIRQVDRLNVDKRDIEDFRSLRDDKGSPLSEGDSKDIFIAAMVTGFNEGVKIELKSKEGFVRTSYLKPEDIAIINSIAVADEGSLNVLLDEKKLFSIAEEYATGGIRLLKDKAFSDDFGTYSKKLGTELIRLYRKSVKEQEVMDEPFELIRTYSIQELLGRNESDSLEFKSSLVWDYKKSGKNKLIEYICAKVISSFMNTDGGILVIGVDDDKTVLGLEKDLKNFKNRSLDEYAVHFTNVINSYLGKMFRPFIKLKFMPYEDKEIAVAYVKEAPRPVYLTYKRKKQFCIRSGNSTINLEMDEANSYIRNKWPNFS